MKANRIEHREWRPYGSDGGYVANGTDAQVQSNLCRPSTSRAGDARGHQGESRWGTLHISSGNQRVPSRQGAYQDYTPSSPRLFAVPRAFSFSGSRRGGDPHLGGLGRRPRQRGRASRRDSFPHAHGQPRPGRYDVSHRRSRPLWYTRPLGSLRERPPSKTCGPSAAICSSRPIDIVAHSLACVATDERLATSTEHDM